MTTDPRTAPPTSEVITALQYVYDTAEQAVWISPDDLSEVSYANEAYERLAGGRSPEAMADPFAYLPEVHPEDRQDRRALRERLAHSASAEAHRTLFRVSDGTGSVRWLCERVFPLSDPDGGVRHWCGVLHEVTDHHEEVRTRRTQVEQLQQVSQTFRHDIRNSANLVMDLLRNARRNGVDEDALAAIESTLERVVDQTESMRDLTKLSLALADDPRPVPLPKAIEGEMASVSLLSESATVEITGDVPDVDVEASAALPTAFRCLIENAVRHNDADSPVVSLSSTLSSESVAVHIADNGPGVPDDEKESVFERGVAASENAGSGLGLSFANKLIIQYGGGIYLTDNDPRGSVFTVVLPRASGEDYGEGGR